MPVLRREAIPLAAVAANSLAAVLDGPSSTDRNSEPRSNIRVLSQAAEGAAYSLHGQAFR